MIDDVETLIRTEAATHDELGEPKTVQRRDGFLEAVWENDGHEVSVGVNLRSPTLHEEQTELTVQRAAEAMRNRQEAA